MAPYYEINSKFIYLSALYIRVFPGFTDRSHADLLTRFQYYGVPQKVRHAFQRIVIFPPNPQQDAFVMS